MMADLRAGWPVLRAATGGLWRDHPARLALAVLGIAFGVALGVAVHLINSSAADEFSLAVRSLSGEADLVVRGPRAGFPDALYPRLARLEGVRAASPGVEVDAQLAGRRETIKVLGLDPFRAAQVQPHLLGGDRNSITELLRSDTVMLSQPAADELRLGAGDSLRLQAGSGVVALHVIGVLPAGATRQRLALMDIATAQWRLGKWGELQRVDLRLQPRSDPQAVRAQLEAIVPAGVIVATPDAESERSTALTRAYRTNLDMLAMVALFTGALLVFSTQFLALLRRRPQLAILRVMGVSRPHLLYMLTLEGAWIGIAGSAIGVAAGCVLAQLGIAKLAGDLGAGYFGALHPRLVFDVRALLAYFGLGVFFAAAGAAIAAFEAARRAPALALKAGDEEAGLRRWRTGVPGLLVIGAGLALSLAPSVDELPIGGYVAIALVLTGAILTAPRFAELALARLPRPRYAPAALAAAQLQATPRQVAVSLAAIVASFSLMVSMLIMVGSFRDSLASWLDQMLPADLYVRAGRFGETGYFTPEEQARIAAVDGVREVAFVRSQNVYMRADRPPVTLLARALPPNALHPPLPFQGARHEPRPGEPPAVWLSEIAADLMSARVGATVDIAVGTKPQRFTVAGIWRDYARQNGAIVIDRARYVELTGDRRVNEAALFLRAGAGVHEMEARLRQALPDAQGLETVDRRELKAISLGIFDRTFAVTYALEAAAVLIGMFGVSAGFSAQALARRREFGVLRHIGMTRRQVGAMLACEGLAVGGLGVIAGLALGWLISLILVHVINRQSFHWSMDMHVPWHALAVLVLTLLAASSLTALASGRRAMSDEVTRAVREDW
jgi:putative ABC transport system permease protein